MRDGSWVERRWFIVLTSVAAAVQAVSVGRALTHPNRPALNIDSAFFEHAGWYLTQGAIPYRDVWDIKPPLAIETTAVFAVLAGGDPLGIHLLTVAATSMAAVGCSLLVGVLAYRLTRDGRAAVLAGLVVATMPGFFYLSANGFRPKYFTLLFGLAGLLSALENRPFLAGVTAAAAAGYWQYGVIFPALAVGITIERHRGGFLRVVVGMSLLAAVAVAPIVARGATVPMAVEVVYVPLVAQAAQPPFQRLGKLVFYLAYALVPVGVGIYGVASAGRKALVRHWWVDAGAAWGVLQLLFDLDSAPDLYVLVVFFAFGVAFAAHRARPRTRRWLTAAFLLIVLVNAVWVGGLVTNPVGEHTNGPANDQTRGVLGTAAEAVDVSRPGTPPRHGIPPVRRLFWRTEIPPSCHYRLSETERDWLALTNRPYRAARCGGLGGIGGR